MNKNRGITLIALIITIIVMIILVAITISIVLRGGLFDYAGNATKDTKEALEYEQNLDSIPEGLGAEGIINYYTQPRTQAMFKAPSSLGLFSLVDQDKLLEMNAEVIAQIEQGGGSFELNNTILGIVLKAQMESIKKYTGAKSVAEENGIVVSTEDSDYPIYMWFEPRTTGRFFFSPVYINVEVGTLYWYSEAEGVYFNPNCCNLFGGMCNLTDISGLASIRTDRVTDMSYMFSECEKLSNIDVLRNWNVSNVTTMVHMFGTEGNYGACPITNTNALSNWDTRSVTDVMAMFFYCTELTNVDLSNWNTNNLVNTTSMFSSCDHVTRMDLRKWNTSNISDSDHMLETGSERLEEIIVGPNWTLSRAAADVPDGTTITVVNN